MDRILSPELRAAGVDYVEPRAPVLTTGMTPVPPPPPPSGPKPPMMPPMPDDK